MRGYNHVGGALVCLVQMILKKVPIKREQAVSGYFNSSKSALFIPINKDYTKGTSQRLW